jgi:thiosulfate/3-mercaptopyruvate sulfurtransferase
MHLGETNMRQFGVVLVFAAWLALVATASAQAVTPLVNVDWLRQNIGRPDMVILDVRNQLGGGSEKAYRQAHIPGAVYSDYLRAGWRATVDGVPGQLPPLADLERLIGDLGIGNDSHVVVVAGGTSSLDMASATRVYWTFKVLGYDRVSVLDGGYDLRPPAQYRGQQRTAAAKRAGTIPGAVNLPESRLTTDGGRFVGAERVAQLLAALGVGTDEAGIVFCNTGHWASLGWFAQSELLGNKKIRLYDGSMADWTARAELPVER